MAVATISAKWTKTAPSFSHPKKVIIEKMGRRAFKMISKRIQDTGKTGDGEKVPPYRKSWFIASAKDPRFDGGHKSSLVMTKDGLKNTKRGGTTRLFKTYAEAKDELGAQGQIGTLTGDMWRAGHVVIAGAGKKSPKGVTVRVTFKGASITSVTQTAVSTNIKTKKVKMKTHRKRIKNVTKANQFERRDKRGKRTKTAQFQMMSVTRAEFSKLSADYLKGIKLIGSSAPSARR